LHLVLVVLLEALHLHLVLVVLLEALHLHLVLVVLLLERLEEVQLLQLE
jgi:hypothetical protein